VRDWIHVDDHTDGIWRAIEAGEIGETYLFGARDQLDNLTVVKSILNQMGKDKSDFELVSDRPGHDLRYAIDPSFAEKSLNWHPQHSSLIEALPGLVSIYSERWESVN
jgi:dTDP-glucose 4,6-dehydratase